MYTVPRRREFGGLTFGFHRGFTTKKEAQAAAVGLRANGYYARVVTDPHMKGYFVYRRGAR